MDKMKNLSLLILDIILIFIGYANQTIAKDSTIEGLYILGPTIYADSLGKYIYYSSDGGRSLEPRCVINWTRSSRYNYDFASDKRYNTIYLAEFSNLYISNDGGINWRIQYVSGYDFFCAGGLRTGNKEGLVLSYYFMTSEDYGLSWRYPSRVGWLGGYYTGPNAAEFAFEDSIAYIRSSQNVFYISYDFYETLDSINVINGIIFRGNQVGEVYIKTNSGNILHSLNNGHSFDTVGAVPIDGLEYVAGYYPGEIYAASHSYVVDSLTIVGGNIDICKSSDYGSSWNRVRKYGTGISEYSNNNKFSDTFFIRNNDLVYSTNELFLFDIRGKLMGKGNQIDISKLQNGIYLLTDLHHKGKILKTN